MPLQPISLLRKASKLLPALLVFVLFASNAAASSVESSVGAGSLDDWLALGLAMLAALYCVQKRE